MKKIFKKHPVLIPISVGIFLTGWFLLIGILSSCFVNLNSDYHGLGKRIEGVPDFYHHVASNWDTNFYKAIAKYGYNAEYKKNFSFFPMLPIEIRVFHVITTIDIEKSAIIVSVINFILYLVVLFYFLKKYLKDTLHYDKHLLIFFLAVLIPFGFFKQLIYTEGLFSFLLLSIFYLLFYSKGRWIYFLPFLSFSLVLTRNIGGVVVFVFLYYLYINRRSGKTVVIISSIFSSAVAVSLFMYTNWKYTGNYFFFISVMEEWGREFDYNILKVAVYDYFVIAHSLIIDKVNNIDRMLRHLFSAFGVVAFLWSIYIVWKKYKFRMIDKMFLFFSVIVCVIPLATSETMSMNRYIIIAPAYFIILPLFIVSKVKKLYIHIILALFFALHSVLLVLFANNYWVG